MTKIYLDTSVFISEFDQASNRHKTLTKFFNKAKKIKDLEFCYSKWALTEMYNRLTKDKIEELKIVKYLNKLLNTNKMRTFKLTVLKVHPRKTYDFDDFFESLSKDLIKYKTGKDRPGLGDIIHVRIMKNNKVNTILTFDNHFEKINGLTTINLLKQDQH